MEARDLHDMLVHAETAMLAEGVEGWRVERVVNRLVYADPDGPDTRYTGLGDDRRALFLRACLARAQAHERAMDEMYAGLRSAGEAYAGIAAQTARDAVDDLVRQLREDLGDKDPDLIVGELADSAELLRVTREALERPVAEDAEDAEVALTSADLRRLEQQLPPCGFEDIILAYDMVLRQPRDGDLPSPFRDSPTKGGGPRVQAPCYESSFGWVHYRGCACKR